CALDLLCLLQLTLQPATSTLFPYTTLFRSYMRDPEDKGHLIPNPETAPIVKQIFEWRKNGIGPSRIVTMLNEKGYPTPSGYKKRSEEHTSELQSRFDIVCRLLLEKKKIKHD